MYALEPEISKAVRMKSRTQSSVPKACANSHERQGQLRAKFFYRVFLHQRIEIFTMNSNMNTRSLNDRIRAVRQGVRATLPLQHRIDTVRKHHAKAKKAARKRVTVDLRNESYKH